MKRIIAFTISLCCLLPLWAQEKEVTESEPYCWRLTQPLGDTYRVPMDTLMLNYYLTDVPASYTNAYGYLGNLGSPGFSKIFFDRPIDTDFIFIDPFEHSYETPSNMTFYNSRIPITQLAYLSGGSNDDEQQRLYATFSGNATSKLEFGGAINYLLARGSYERQATKEVDYQLFSSYRGDRYEYHAYVSSLDYLVQENGGIADDIYITNPSEMDSGETLYDAKNIPVNLSDAYSHVTGFTAYATQRYNLGFSRDIEIPDSLLTPQDTVNFKTEFVPVSSLIHTVNYTGNTHRFIDYEPNNEFFANTYFDSTQSYDSTRWWKLENTLAISLREGFNKYAQMGLSAYLTYQYSSTSYMNDVIALEQDSALTPIPDDELAAVTPRQYDDNNIWVGGEIARRQGKYINYVANGRLGLLGSVLGDVEVDGSLFTSIPLFGDTVQVNGYGFFYNQEPSAYYQRYYSNHFIWENDFDKVRRFRVGGQLAIPHWGTRLDIGVESLQNYVYFDNNALPAQESSLIQVFKASLQQNFRFGILNLDNKVDYQLSSNQDVIPLPTLSAYSNFYLLFRIAKVLHVQLGADCTYNTAYYAQAYQPATMAFYTQDEVKVGGYPLTNVYVNMKLKEIRFFVLYSHVNQGLYGGESYFSLPHYPLPYSMLQMGVSVDFTN